MRPGGRLKVVVAGITVLMAVSACAPYDLVIANILAEPLIALAPDIERVLAVEGTLVLSGLLTAQQGQVEAAYDACGLETLRAIVLGEWSTMVLKRRKAGC